MLSVVITAWNEEKTLPRVVSSVKHLADEIVVVVDKASTDETLEVARKLGCKVFSHPHTGIVEPMRNFSIAKAKGDWILLLDADEEVSKSLGEEIEKIISNADASDFYRIARKNLIFGKWIKSSHWWPDYVYRLFKKGSITWDDTIHSIPLTRGKGTDLKPSEDLAIIHHHYETITQYVERLNRYTDFQVRSLQESGYAFSWKDLVIKPIDEFIRQYFARSGHKDGIAGLALSLLQSFSELVLYLKLWQESQFVDRKITLEEISEVIASKKKEWRWWTYEAKIRDSNILLKVWLKFVRRIGL
jgi:(heptosyl)LPS beta-1,4-glucosyltransferase